MSNNSNISSNEKYKDGTLYFYDSDNNLLGTYNCVSTKCSYGKSIIDDTDYSIDYLNTKSQDFNIVNNRFIFIHLFTPINKILILNNKNSPFYYCAFILIINQ